MTGQKRRRQNSEVRRKRKAELQGNNVEKEVEECDRQEENREVKKNRGYMEYEKEKETKDTEIVDMEGYSAEESEKRGEYTTNENSNPMEGETID